MQRRVQPCPHQIDKVVAIEALLVGFWRIFECISESFHRVTPYPHEPTGWIIENTGPEVCLFSSDFPHVEGGRNPMKRFGGALKDTPEADQQRFYRDNFIDLMGAGLDPSLHDHPYVRSQES